MSSSACTIDILPRHVKKFLISSVWFDEEFWEVWCCQYYHVRFPTNTQAICLFSLSKLIIVLLCLCFTEYNYTTVSKLYDHKIIQYYVINCFMKFFQFKWPLKCEQLLYQRVKFKIIFILIMCCIIIAVLNSLYRMIFLALFIRDEAKKELSRPILQAKPIFSPVPFYPQRPRSR